MHANKLKRKLADLGVETNHPKLTESFCLIGTPLPPLEKSKDTGEFVPLWKQEVRDEKGRRRLHGAFTGGFSAGYYNTVGSAEGWTPSTFTSSRSDRAKQKQARPEDFMDDEDRAEFMESQKLVDTTEEMDFLGGTQAELGQGEGDSMASALRSLIPPSKDSLGARLLKKMGWKPGQGIGPKVTYKQLQLQDQQLQSQYGWSSAVTESIDDGDEEAKKHMYPPRDTKLVVYRPKDNSFGLGYTPGARLQGSSQGTKGEEDGGLKISAGFGLGALNDADDDDVDIYEGSYRGQAQRRHMAYDEGEEHEGEEIIITMGQPAKKSPNKNKNIQQTTSETFRSGVPVLDGFVRSKQEVVDALWFDPPKIPDDWEPDPRRVWSKDAALVESEKENQAIGPVVRGPHRTVLTADQRGATLGETPLPSTPKSVFDYLAPKDRERLRNLSGTTLNQATPSPSQGDVPPSQDVFSIPRLDPTIAKAALAGYQPFESDPAKAARYKAYLQSQIDGDDDSDPPRPAPGQSNETFYQELLEFAKSAKIFKPVGGALGGRFASAKVVDTLKGGREGLYVPDSVGESGFLGEEEEKEPELEQKEDPMVQAARLGMFGALTRQVKDWTPARLLCKRFGVKEPLKEVATDTDIHVNDQDWKSQLPSQEQINSLGQSDAPSEELMKAATTSFRSKGKDLSNIGLGEDDEQGRDTLTYVKPERDIFKAIFESGSEAEEEPEAKSPQLIPSQLPAPALPTASVTENHLISSSSTQPTYDPAANNNDNPPNGSSIVDLSTFRPTFVPKPRPEGEKKNKKDKKKSKDLQRKGKAILSFADDGEDSLSEKPRERKRKKDRKEKKSGEAIEEDDDMWVEKSVPVAVKGYEVPRPPREEGSVQSIPCGEVNMDVDVHNIGGRTSTRMRAADFI